MLRLTSLVFCLFFFVNSYSQAEIYELRVYELKFSKSADVLHDYFQKALIPALNRQGIEHIGAFEELGDAMPKKLYLLIYYADFSTYEIVTDELENDDVFDKEAQTYWTTTPENIPFSRVESSFIRATDGFPNLVKPTDNAGVYELRIYEGYNEDALRRKVKMFNDSEFDIFKDVGLNLVFFGANISGDQMPCLTYLLAFEDLEQRNNIWSKFGPHPEWQRISKLEEYSNTVSSISRVFLKPLSYSQL
jgi:hypothetical protein